MALHTVLESSKWDQFLSLYMTLQKGGHFLYAAGRQVIREKILQSILNKQCNGDVFRYNFLFLTYYKQMLPINIL